MKTNRLVNWFWNSFVKSGDEKRMAGQAVPDFDDAVVDVDYVGDGHKLHTLNVYRPRGNREVLPVILDVHGGGWYYGDKELNSYFCRSLVREGFAVVDVSYRVAPEGDIFTQIKDICAAMEFVGAHAEEFGLDMQNFFIVGDSAGGHIAALIAHIAVDEKLQKKFDVAPCVAPSAVGLICPALEPLDIAPLPKSFMRFYFNPIFGKRYLKNGVKDLVSFKSVFNKNMCPCFFSSSYGDFLKKQAKRGYEFVKSQGVETELVFMDKQQNKEHALAHVFNVLNWEWEESDIVNRAMCEFFKKYIRQI